MGIICIIIILVALCFSPYIWEVLYSIVDAVVKFLDLITGKNK